MTSMEMRMRNDDVCLTPAAYSQHILTKGIGKWKIDKKVMSNCCYRGKVVKMQFHWHIFSNKLGPFSSLEGDDGDTFRLNYGAFFLNVAPVPLSLIKLRYSQRAGIAENHHYVHHWCSNWSNHSPSASKKVHWKRINW